MFLHSEFIPLQRMGGSEAWSIIHSLYVCVCIHTIVTLDNFLKFYFTLLFCLCLFQSLELRLPSFACKSTPWPWQASHWVILHSNDTKKKVLVLSSFFVVHIFVVLSVVLPNLFINKPNTMFVNCCKMVYF